MIPRGNTETLHESGIPAGNPAGWRGKRGAAADAVRHRWQKDAAAGPLEHLSTQEHRWRLKLAAVLASFVALVALFVFYLLYAPVQTPLLAIGAPAGQSYAWPLRPHAWAAEDIANLSLLDGHTLNVVDLSPDWRSSNVGMSSFQRQLEQLAQHGARGNALIVYIALHGAVDGQGRACLVPPGASPHNSDTWLPVEEVLARIGSYEQLAQRNKLVILDCNRLLVDWNLGMAYNTFAERLAAAVDKAAVRNLAVLNSTSPGQIGAASADMQASVFGNFVQLGLAGAADAEASGMGAGNRRVSLRELHGYVARHVDDWSRRNRASGQRPMLLPREAADFDVAWALKPRSLRGLIESTEAVVRETPPVRGARIKALWQARDELAATTKPYRFDPIAWREVEGKLIWLEEAAESGAAYATAAVNVATQLQRQLVEEQGRSLSEKSTTGLPSSSVHSLPLAERNGTIGAEQANRLRAALEQLAASPSQPALVDILAALAPDDRQPAMAEVHFLRLLTRDFGPGLWQRPDVISAAIRVRNQALAATVPDDVRAFYAVRSVIAQADGRRRAAENGMFLGGADVLVAALSDWQAAAVEYDEADSLSLRVTAALDSRDRALAELPQFARWLARPLPADVPAGELDRLLGDVLLPLVDRLHGLSRAIDAHRHAEEAAGRPATAFLAQAGDAEEQWRILRATFDAEVQRLLNAKNPGPAEYRDIDALLVTPLLSAADRDRLRRVRHQLAVAMHGQYDLSTAGDGVEPDTGDQAGDNGHAQYLQRMTSVWRRHPALAILQPARDDTTSSASQEDVTRGTSGSAYAVGARLRTLLARVGRATRELAESTLAVTASNEDRSADSSSLSQAEHMLRAAAPFWFEPPDFDPVVALRRHDVQNLLVWHADRALDEMWGAAADDERPFFETTAGDYLAAARQLIDPLPVTAGRIARVEERLEKLRQAVRAGVSVAAVDVPLVDQTEDVLTTAQVEGDRLAMSPLEPAGQAVLFFSDSRGRLDGTSRAVGLPLPATEGQNTVSHVEQFRLSGPSLVDRGPHMQATLLVRGNRVSAPFLLRPPGGVAVRFERHVYGNPTVTLGGREKQRPSVVFVLDCSRTMRDPAESIEGPDAEPTTRIQAAKYALERMLTRLAADGNARVGVRLFGHRAGWHKTRPGEVLYQNGYGRPFDRSLDPAADVEEVLRLGRFDSVLAGDVANLLETVQPWGQSPLYLALSQAAGDFAGEGVDAQKSIVVITDGENYQFNAAEPTGADAVLAAAAENAVPIHIVEFAAPGDAPSASLEELKGIAEQTGGSYVPVAAATSLVERLENLLGSQEYQVFDNESSAAFGPARIGSPVVISPPPARPRNYTVALKSITGQIELAGGEDVQLLLAPGGTHLQSIEYEQGTPRFETLMNPARPAEDQLLVGVHRPITFGEGVSFPISFQHADREFVPRPADVWIEITPLLEDGSPAPHVYTFYDVNYEPGTPVPVLKWLAEQWPAAARQAEVRVWCKPVRTPPTWTATHQVRAQAPHADHRLPGLEGVTYQVRARRGDAPGEPLTVMVIQRHPQQAPPLAALRVEISPGARQVVHRFDAESRRVIHIFQLEPPENPAAAEFELRFTARRDVQADALQMAEPAVVDIAGGDDLIQLGPQLPGP